MPKSNAPISYESTGRERRRWDARFAFLKAVAQYVPAVLADLRGEPFEMLQRVGTKENLYSRTVGAAVSPLISAWTQRHGLEAGWVKRVAWDTLLWWWEQNDSTSGWSLIAPYVPAWRLSADGQYQGCFSFEFFVSDPTMVSVRRSALKAEISTKFEDALKKFLDGLEQPPEGFLRFKRSNNLARDARFLALYIAGQTYGEICGDDENLEESTVRTAVHKMAKLIEIPLPEANQRRAVGGQRKRKTTKIRHPK